MPAQVYAAGTGCGSLGDQIRHRTVSSVENALGWPGECDLVLAITSRGRMWAMMEPCCWENWVSSALRDGVHSGHRPHPRWSACGPSSMQIGMGGGCGCCA